MNPQKSSTALSDLISEIRENHQKIIRDELKLKKLINHFVSLLGRENLMGLSVAEVKDYLELARHLEEFEEKSQVDTWEEQLAVRYADLVTEVASLTKPMESYQSKVEAMVSEFNQILAGFDFDPSFPRLQLSYVSSKHPLESLLAHIQQFSAQHANQLGAGTLFSQTENQQGNHQAIDLMINLYHQLTLIHGDFLDPCMFFHLNILHGEQPETGEITDLPALQMSKGLIRIYEILTYVGFIVLVYRQSNQTDKSSIQCVLDNLHEFELNRIEQLIDWTKGLSLSITSASVSPVYLPNIDQVYRLKEKSVGTISAYQILSRAG